MIKVSVLYPNNEGTTFNHDYYANQHMALVNELLGPAGLRGTGVEKGLAGGAPDAPAPFHSIGYLLFDSLEQFQAAFAPNAERIMGDIPNYTNVEPVVQISEVIA